MERVSSRLVDLTDDALSCILSFLRPADLCACSRACKRLREVCSEDGKAWSPMCERRWGSVTDVRGWGNGRISHRLLYETLARWEHVIGFWRGVGNGGGGGGFLALFEWAPHCIVGHKLVPACLNTCAVSKIPFLWMTISEDEQVTGFLDPTFKTLGMSDVGSSSDTSLPCDCSLSKNNTICPPSNHAHIVPNALGGIGMLSVDVHFVGNRHLVIEEKAQQSRCALNELAEAATVAAFGSSLSQAEPIVAICGGGSYSGVVSPYSSSSETESYIRNPPASSFQYEMYQFLTSKVASAGGDRAARKQKQRDKELAWSHGKSLLEPEHFVKVVPTSPTKARPLQGLWKGFF